MDYGVATISRLLKIIGLFCRISSLWYVSFAKETYNFKELTNRSHPTVSCVCALVHGMHVCKREWVCVCVGALARMLCLTPNDMVSEFPCMHYVQTFCDEQMFTCEWHKHLFVTQSTPACLEMCYVWMTPFVMNKCLGDSHVAFKACWSALCHSCWVMSQDIFMTRTHQDTAFHDSWHRVMNNITYWSAANIHEWVIPHTQVSHVALMKESCHTCKWVMSHSWRGHVTHVSESCRTHEGVMSHM